MNNSHTLLAPRPLAKKEPTRGLPLIPTRGLSLVPTRGLHFIPTRGYQRQPTSGYFFVFI